MFFNLGMPETVQGDARWETIRNIPFRKTIETIGALLVAVVTMTLVKMECQSQIGRTPVINICLVYKTIQY